MMSRYALILNYSDMRLQDNSSDLQSLGRIALHPDKPSDNLDLNDPLQYLTEGLNLHSLPKGKRITVRQGFQEDYLTSRKLEIDAAILKNHPPSLNSYRDNTKHWQEYLGMSKCFEMDNGDPDNVVPKVIKKPIEVDELGNLISFHELNKKHQPDNKFLKSVLNNLVDKDEESIVEQVDPPIDSNSKSSLNILMNSIKRANGIPVDNDNWLNLPKPDPTINIPEIKPTVENNIINIATDENNLDTSLEDTNKSQDINSFYSSNLINKLKLIDSKKELILKYSFNVKNNCNNAIKQFEVFTDKDRQIHLSAKVPELPVKSNNEVPTVLPNDKPTPISKLSERIKIINDIMNNRSLTYKNRKAEVARILEFNDIELPRESERGGFAGVDRLIEHQKKDAKLAI
ncbi:unnamed protein product, partial [Rotaria socialis]